MVGLAGAKAPFGASLTARPLYQATALADTQLWCIPLTDFATSPQLKQQLLPQVSQRLRQTELLLAVYGQPRVADRFHSLLQLLKQEIGQPVADGTRLLVRLTHEDLATACCTTRVTITRLLKKTTAAKEVERRLPASPDFKQFVADISEISIAQHILLLRKLFCISLVAYPLCSLITLQIIDMIENQWSSCTNTRMRLRESIFA